MRKANLKGHINNDSTYKIFIKGKIIETKNRLVVARGKNTHRIVQTGETHLNHGVQSFGWKEGGCGYKVKHE